MNRRTLLRTAAGALLLAAGLSVAAPAVQAQDGKTLCVYDPSGKNGDAYKQATRYQTFAAGKGVKFNLKPYTDEAIAAQDFANGQCDAALLTGVRAQKFSKASYSVEALGLLQSYDDLGNAIKVLAKERAANLMVSGDYEVAGIFPAGAVYLYVRDKGVTDVRALAGKKVATISFDDAAMHMVRTAGATPVPADIGTFASLFNEGGVDVCYAPATAYNPLELHRGIGSTGGVIRYPVTQLTLQILVRKDAFPEGFGQQSREWGAAQYGSMLSVVKKGEASVKAEHWIDLPQEDHQRYRDLLGKVRGELTAKGQYDPTVVALLEQMTGQ
ncbi:MAG: putative solute-binding protein [Myxococcota bacterium]|nr:putative solute-binding protein [Myxococcota bacterium]